MKKYISLVCVLHMQIFPALIHCPSLCDTQDYNQELQMLIQDFDSISQNRELNLEQYKDIDRIVLIIPDEDAGLVSNMISTLTEQELSLQLNIHKGYRLPDWVNEKSLIVCLSYSGDKEEIVSCFKAAQEKNAPIIGITSGGILCDALLSNDYDVIDIPDGLTPRAALGYLTIPLLYLSKKIGSNKKGNISLSY